MERIDNISDQMHGVVTYRLPNGDCVRVDAFAAREYGAGVLLESAGYSIPKARPLPVLQRGKVVGMLSSDFDPALAKSASPLYDFRPGDFTRQGDEWIASPLLGYGDLVAAGAIDPEEYEKARRS